MNYVFLLLAGKSLRFGGDTPKQFLLVNNQYIFEYPLKTFDSLKEIAKIFLVCDEEHYSFLNNYLKTQKFNHEVSLVLGGKTRQESVYNGLKTLQNSTISGDNVLFHDACRPLVRRHEILDIIKALNTYEGASLAVPLFDSLCKENNMIIDKSIKRENLMKLQTPQAFKFDIIYKAHKKAIEMKENSYTDDTSLLLANGARIKLVEGSIFNFKITTKDDLILFNKLVEGYDFD